MKVADYVKQCNRSVNVMVSSVRHLKKKYISMYRAYMIQLYDKGYISDPTCFQEKEIRKNISDLGIGGVILTSGVVNITSRQIGFALAKNVNLDEDGKEFLGILQKALYYRELSLEVDKFYTYYFIDKTSVKEEATVPFKLAISGSKIFTRNMPFEVSAAMLECMFSSVSRGTEVRKYTYHEELFNKALVELGLEGNESDGLFVKGMKRKDEIEYCELILNGQVSLTGTEAGRLEDWLRNHSWDHSIDDRYAYLKKGLYTYMIENPSTMLPITLNMLESESNRVGQENIIAFTQDTVYCLEKVEKEDFPISSFVIFAGEKDIISTDDKNTLEGFTGEVYDVDYLKANNGIYVGCPIELYSPVDWSKRLYVDLEQTSFYNQSLKQVTWFGYVGSATIDFYDVNIYLPEKYKEGSFEEDIFESFCNSENGSTIGKVRYRLSEAEDEEFENAKQRVCKSFIAGGKLKNRRDGILALLDGNITGAYDFLKKDYTDSQFKALCYAVEKGLGYDYIYKLANPQICGKAMKDIIEGVVKQ